MTPQELTQAIGGRWLGRYGIGPCPVPGHGRGRGDKSPSLSIECGTRQPIVVHCHAGCSGEEVIRTLCRIGLLPAREPLPAPTAPVPRADAASNIELARRLWSRREPLAGTPAEAYMRKGRGIHCALPPTLAYLRAYGEYPHAMIAAFGVCEEPEPGNIVPPVAVTAIHLTALSMNGLTRTQKRMLGPVSGQPLVLAPPNDAMGLCIAEGIEDALSLHQATGLGAWAGGSAGHMAKLGNVVSDFIDCIAIAEDPNAAGRQATRQLASHLSSRGIEVKVLRLNG